MPHSAFQGQTPDEAFFGIGDEVPKRPCRSTRVGSRETNEGKPSRGMRRMRRRDDFGGVAITTAAVQNVVRRSSAKTFGPLRARALKAAYERRTDK
jgi:hypothetical protein